MLLRPRGRRAARAARRSAPRRFGDENGPSRPSQRKVAHSARRRRTVDGGADRRRAIARPRAAPPRRRRPCRARDVRRGGRGRRDGGRRSGGGSLPGPASRGGRRSRRATRPRDRRGRNDAQRVRPHALAGEMAQRLDLAVAEEFGQPVAAHDRQHGGERIEREGAPRLRIRRLRPTGVGGRAAGGGRGGEGSHGASGPRTVTRSAVAAAASGLSSVASGKPLSIARAR